MLEVLKILVKNSRIYNEEEFKQKVRASRSGTPVCSAAQVAPARGQAALHGHLAACMGLVHTVVSYKPHQAANPAAQDLT